MRTFPGTKKKPVILVSSLLLVLCLGLIAFMALSTRLEDSPNVNNATTTTPDSASKNSNPSSSDPSIFQSSAQWGDPVFEDNFDDPELPQWRIRDYDYVGYDHAFMKAENVSVRDGELVITTKREAEPKRFKNDTRQRDRYYSTGYVDTIGKFSQQYGRFEMRAKLPVIPGKSRGIWPAFWMRPDDKTNPGEIDIMEAYGTPHPTNNDNPMARSEATVHFSQDGKEKIRGFTPEQFNLNDGQFHTWAVEWTPAAITFFVDDQQYHQVTADTPNYQEFFTNGGPFHLRINTQVGSDNWGDPTEAETADTVEYIIDYVKVWPLQ